MSISQKKHTTRNSQIDAFFQSLIAQCENGNVLTVKDVKEGSSHILTFKIENHAITLNTRHSEKRAMIKLQHKDQISQGGNRDTQFKLPLPQKSTNIEFLHKSYQEEDEEMDKDRLQELIKKKPEEAPREAKNIIKNIVNGFKKFLRSLCGADLSKISRKTILVRGEIVLVPNRGKDWNKNSTAQKVETEFRKVFQEDLVIPTSSESKPQKSNVNYNRSLLGKIFEQEHLKNLFKFWLNQLAHFYIVRESGVREESVKDHRNAINTLIDHLHDDENKILNPPPTFKHGLTAQLPDPQISIYVIKQGKIKLTQEKEEPHQAISTNQEYESGEDQFFDLVGMDVKP